MTALIARLDDWSDRLSPILVKEIRQMVRGRDFNYSFGISLLAGFFVAFFGLGYALTSIGESGAWVFSALMVCLALLGLIVVPLGAFSTLRSERVDQTLDLITQTTLTPRGIVIGKLMTQWVKLITLFAGLAPFIAMSFLLGGIDLLTILISLAVLFMWSMWVCSLCLFLSAASQARAMSALIFIGMIIGFIGIVVTFAPLIARAGIVGMPRASWREMGWFLAGSTAVCFTSMTNLVLLAENRLSLAIEDRSTALRIGFFVQFLLAVACLTLPFLAGATGYTVTDMADGLGIVGGIHLALTATFAVTEDMTLSRRVFKRVRKSLKWPWLAIFRPGGGRGAAWILTQMAVLLAIGLYAVGPAVHFRWLLAICSYICFFSGVPTVVARRVFKEKCKTSYLRAGILLFFPLLGVSADILQYLFAPSFVLDGTFSAYHITNPLRALSNWTQVEAQGWQWRPLIMGFAGLLAYLDLYRMGRREDKHAANPG